MSVNKYDLLAEDLKEAMTSAVEAAENVSDGGTCNFDEMILFLPRWNYEKVQQAAEKAGTRACELRYCGQKHIGFSAPVWAMGNKRTVQAEAMEKCMRAKGYDAYVYYEID